MKLSKVIIENYRGFYGKNEIEFDTNKKTKNINLLIARNDTGKTTFLNAIYWCLYGEEQFSSSKNSDKKILSNKKIMETSPDGKMKLSVTLVFNDEKGPKYEITRQRVFKRGSEELKFTQQEEKFFGMQMNSKGTGFEDIEYINDFIASKIPQGISSFFLLDGEQLKAIFVSEINYKIRDSIERVANIGAINGLIDNLKDLDRKYSGMKSGIDPNFAAIQKNIDDLEVQQEDKEKKRNENMKETENLKKQLSELIDFLQNHNESMINQYASNEKRIREENEKIDENIKEVEGELNKLVVDSYILANSKKSLNDTLKKFEEIMKGGDFPPAFDPAHVLQLLKRKECICGGKIKKGSEEEKRLQKLADVKSFKEYVKIISQGAAWIPKEIESLNENIQEIAKKREKLSEFESQLQKNNKELEEIKQNLKDSDVDEIKDKANEKEIIERAIMKNEREMVSLERDLEDINLVKKDYEREITNIKIKGQKEQIIIKKSEKCKQLIDYAKEIKEEIMRRIKEKIQDATAKNFIELHWKADDYEKVTISDDFSLSIKDKYKGEIINELSQGAALCFGLAFMTALRNYSGYDVPIIIDSPVGKIDEGNREKIAKNLPIQLKGNQVIFLVTSSEYTSVFKETLKDKISTKVNLTYNKKTGEIDIKYGGN